MKKPRVLLCDGSSCKKKHKSGFKKLAESLSAVADVMEVGCQDICKGPIAGIPLKGKLVWFKELETGKDRDALVALLTEGKLKKRLEKHRVGKH